MASTQQSETTIFLRSPLDWHAWEREFRSYVATYDLSDKFFREEPFLARPVQPKIPDYPTQLQTRSQSSATP